ncbi:hypothetical protein [Pelagimonas varians]|uniref:Uncharacterized protein n=1 Tax=Pelagimonas varians TaxID=696760 RepID=A0A238L105_9RHOB|nr:hypothetical protein [Pelagimonas varians]PYG27182.1 hypothetical protein C8N36_11728 [Pelagimonas varians]SMX48774.1 hypothetical protein PEV8663_03953 [Pelagimonas varians]
MKTLLIAGVLTLSSALTVHAEEADLTPQVMAQITMSEQLMALGTARDEPLLILAAMRLRATLDGPTAAPGDGFTTQKDMAAAAMKLAEGDDALTGIVEDVTAESARRMCIYARNGACY